MQQLGGPLGDIIETVPVRRQEKLLKMTRSFQLRRENTVSGLVLFAG
uniref:Uncharacterized protein n=1 Tax=Anguilla anguilla TaxID=7936 RepID=A0A0E9V7Z1_ANGAN